MGLGLNAPTKNVFLIAVVLGVLGIVGHFVAIPIVTPWAFWLLVAGFVLLVVASLVKGI
ncbi:MAG: hypothetical protein HQL53_12115 [Magnetococcales bacterium]|nr:hypothetical protein [Magnetococcales bacterium]